MQRDFLLGCAVVLVLSVEWWLVLAVTAFVAHADAIGVVTSYVATFEAERAAVVERTVTPDVEVIPWVLAEATGPVACSKFPKGEVLTRTRVRAVQHDQINPPEVRSWQVQTQQGLQFRP